MEPGGPIRPVQRVLKLKQLIPTLAQSISKHVLPSLIQHVHDCACKNVNHSVYITFTCYLLWWNLHAKVNIDHWQNSAGVGGEVSRVTSAGRLVTSDIVTREAWLTARDEKWYAFSIELSPGEACNQVHCIKL